MRIRIWIKGLPEFKIVCEPLDLVGELRSKIANQIGFEKSRLTIIYRGSILVDEITLAGYSIRDDAKVCVVIKKLKRKNLLPQDLVCQLQDILYTFGEGTHEEFLESISKIIEICNNPILTQFAKDHPQVQAMIDEALEVIQTTEAPLSEESIRYVSQFNDVIFLQLETAPDGMKFMKEMLNELNQGDDNFQQNLPTIIPEKAQKVSEAPLPVPWFSVDEFESRLPSTDSLKFENYVSMDTSYATEYPVLKERFSNQINDLKRMGFSDDMSIIFALDECGGNVQLAACLLQRMCSP